MIPPARNEKGRMVNVFLTNQQIRWIHARCRFGVSLWSESVNRSRGACIAPWDPSATPALRACARAWGDESLTVSQSTTRTSIEAHKIADVLLTERSGGPMLHGDRRSCTNP